jgi:hypothetical protein
LLDGQPFSFGNWYTDRFKRGSGSEADRIGLVSAP